MISDHESWWYITSSVALCTSLFALNSLSYDSRNCWNCKKTPVLKSPWRACCAHPQASSTLEIEPGILGDFGDRAWARSLPLTGGIQPSQPCRVRQCVASFPSGWQCHDCSAPWFSSQFVFGSPAQRLQLNHWTNQWNLGKSLQMLHRFRKPNQQTTNSSISSNCWFLFSRRFLNCTYSWATSEHVAWVCKLHLVLSSLRRFYLDLFEASCIEMNRAFRSHTANLSTMYIIVWNMHVRGKTYV